MLGALAFGALPAAADTAGGCPTSNAPNELTLAGGTPQSAKLGSAFDAGLQVALANTDGCPLTTPLAGIAVTFTAPGSGPSGTFASSGQSAVLVGTNASGSAAAPPFTANTLPGGYLVVASSDYGSVSFSLVNTASGVPATIVPVAPGVQKATVSGRYGQPLQAQVLDANGAPVGGVAVSFSLGGSGGSGNGSGGAASASASFDGGSAQATALTDAAGIAVSPRFTAGTAAGTFTAVAATAGVASVARFPLDNLAGKPPKLVALGKKQLTAAVNERYARTLAVLVTSSTGRPLEGQSVTFSLGSGAGGGGGAAAGASFVGGNSQATETTDARGVADSPRFVAGAVAGKFTAAATLAGANAAATFSLDNVAARPPKAVPLGKTHLSARVNDSYSRPLRVRVTSSSGRPLEGQTVTFSLGSGSGGGAGAGAGASFVGGSSQATETTSAAGIAVSPRFVAGSTAGKFTAAATVAGSNSAATFVLDNLAAGSVLAALGADELSATVDGRFARPLQARVLDGHGNPLEGQTVTFTLGSGGGGGGAAAAGASFVGGAAQATATTDARGVAVSPRLLANGTAGTFTAAATLSGHADAAMFSLRNVASAPASVGAGAGATQSAPVGTRFPIPLAVTVTDKNGNAVAGALVTFSAPASGAGGTFAGGRRTVHVHTNAKGIAVAPAFTAGGQAGGYVVRAAAAGAPAAGFALVNEPRA